MLISHVSGDIAFRYLNYKNDAPSDSLPRKVTVCDINDHMLQVGEERALSQGITQGSNVHNVNRFTLQLYLIHYFSFLFLRDHLKERFLFSVYMKYISVRLNPTLMISTSCANTGNLFSDDTTRKYDYCQGACVVHKYKNTFNGHVS